MFYGCVDHLILLRKTPVPLSCFLSSPFQPSWHQRFCPSSRQTPHNSSQVLHHLSLPMRTQVSRVSSCQEVCAKVSFPQSVQMNHLPQSVPVSYLSQSVPVREIHQSIPVRETPLFSHRPVPALKCSYKSIPIPECASESGPSPQCFFSPLPRGGGRGRRNDPLPGQPLTTAQCL